MSPNVLFRSLDVRPFEGFRMHLSDGTSHDVTHPEMLMVGTRTSVLFVPTDDDARNANGMIRIDNLHVTKLTPLNAVAKAG